MAANLAELIDESEEGILRHLRHRFSHGKTYTRLGYGSLIVINPNEQLPVYDGTIAERYSLDDSSFQQPNTEAHIYSIAGHLLSNVAESRRLTLRFRGDSGAGKTANLFHVLRFLAVQRNATALSWDKVDALEVICAAFSGAETSTSDSSTRCGYRIDLGYSRGLLSSFAIRRTLPLELSRLVGGGSTGYKNYSVLYQFCAGLDPKSRKHYGVRHASSYFFLNNLSSSNGSIDEEEQRDEQGFQKLCAALRTVGFTDNQQDLIWRLVAALLHTGNLFFHSHLRRPQVANEAELGWIATLLEINQAALLNYFGEADSVEECLNRRDALAQALYRELHSWLLSRISRLLSGGVRPTGTVCDSTLTLIDMPGPVKQPRNGLNELCVNMVNEVAEDFYLRSVFSSLRSLLDAEEVSGISTRLRFPSDNQRVMSLLGKRSDGLVSILEDECKFPKGSDESLLQRVCINHTTNGAYKALHDKDGMIFGIKHHHGTVWYYGGAGGARYSAQGMVESNKWTEPLAIHRMLATSENPSISAIFAPLVNGRPEGSERVNYVASQFAAAAKSLFDELKNTRCYFVHCLRPNATRRAGHFDAKLVTKQIRTHHLLDHYKLTRYGFVQHVPIATFVRDYQCLVPNEVISGKSLVRITKCVIESMEEDHTDDYRIGVCSVFLRDQLMSRLQAALALTRNMAATTIQKNYKRWTVERHYRKTRSAAIRIQAALRHWRRKRSEVMVNGVGNSARGENYAATATGCPIPIQWELPTDLQKRLCEMNGILRESPFRHTTEYLPATHVWPLATATDAIVPATIEEFARENIKHHILGARREPILSPFLPPKSDSDFESAVETFRIVLRYTHDTTLRDDQTALLSASIMRRGIENAALRDELYTQLINQTYRNPVEQSAKRAWDLLLAAVSCFAPSSALLPVARSYFQNSTNSAPLTKLLINGLLRISAIESAGSSGRCKSPTALEHVALKHRQSAAVSVRIADGGKGEEVDVEVDSWTSAGDVLQRVLHRRGVIDVSNWCLELRRGAKSIRVSPTQPIFDGIATLEEFQSAQPSTAIDDSFLVLFSQPQLTQLRIHQPSSALGSSPPAADVVARSLSSRAVLARYNNVQNNGGLLIANGGDQVYARRMNPNCMSRITEEDGPASRQPSFIGDNDFSKLTIASRIRRMPLPSRGEDVGKFLDEVFEQALPHMEESPVGTLSPRSAELVRRVAASIKGGMGRQQNHLDSDGTDDHSDDDGTIYQQSDSRISASVRGLRRTAAMNEREAAAFCTAPYPSVQHRGARRIDSGSGRQTVGDLACFDAALVDGPQWVSDGELLSMLPHGDWRDWRANSGGEVSQFSTVTSVTRNGGNKAGRLPPVLRYKNQPFEIVVRKELFLPNEELDDGAEIDAIFAQIIADCRHQGATSRIRPYERESVMHLLREYTTLDGANACDAPTSVKLHVIEVARRWPLYFSRLYPVVREERFSHAHHDTPLIVGIGETGVRLLSLEKNADNGDSLRIQEHFEFGEIVKLSVEGDGSSLRIVTRNNIEILIGSTRHSLEIKHCIEHYMRFDAAEPRRYMLAVANYASDAEEMLDFRAGDFIQIVDDPPIGSRPPFGSPSWLYGKVRQTSCSSADEMGSSVGWFLSEYTEPVTEEGLYSDGENAPLARDVAPDIALLSGQEVGSMLFRKHYHPVRCCGGG